MASFGIREKSNPALGRLHHGRNQPNPRFTEKSHIQGCRGARLRSGMKRNNGATWKGRFGIVDRTQMAMERMELYCAAHPGSPSAARRPRLLFRSQLWIALLGPSVEEGIVGIGATVEAALRAFDAQYLAGLRPPAQVLSSRGAFCTLKLGAA
jgi:hypothetical protein